MNEDSKILTSAELDEIARLAEQAKCLPALLSSLPYLTRDATIGMLLACHNFAEDIQKAMHEMLKVRPG